MKRFICILSALLILMSVSFAAVAYENGMLTKPTVFLSGNDEYNIVWATVDSAAAFVEITAGGKTYLYRDEYDGVLRTDDYIHTVRVPKAQLDRAGSYTIISREVNSNTKSGVTYSTDVRENYTFNSDKGKNDISVAFFSDLHLKPAEFERLDIAKSIMDSKMGTVDVIALVGDITDAMPTEMYFAETLLEASHRLSGGAIPVVYARGNHEARGEYAQFIDRYLSFEGGKMYGTVEFGPMSAIVADCGEDKPDYQVEYGGLVDFDNYLTEQYEWLKSLGGYDGSKPYRVAISHSPKVLDRMYSAECIDILEGYGTDIQVGGHYHSAQLYGGEGYPIVTDGGIESSGYRAGLLKLSGDSLSFEVWNKELTSVFSHSDTVKQKTLTEQTETDTEQYVQNSPLTPVATGSGIAIKGSSYSPTVTVPPTVFDCGDMYSIVYAADSGSNLTKAQAVVTAKDGRVYTFTDAKAGNAVSSPLHSIAVPKQLLDGGSYVIKTTYLGAYGAYGENYTYEGVSTDIGLTVTSQSYSFKEINAGDKLTLASFSGARGIKSAVNAKNALSAEPDIIVLGGDMSDGLYTQKDFIQNVLVFASTLSGGTKPVILTRGEGECYGDWAPYISQILRTSEGGAHNGMYFATSYGDINLVVCDTQDALLSKTYMQAQREWLSTLTVEGGECTFFVGADADRLKALTADVYGLLGGAALISGGGEYGTVTAYSAKTLTQQQGSIFGLKDAPPKTVDATVSDGKRDTAAASSPSYKTDDQKTAPESYTEAVVEKPTDLSWHTLLIYEWYERGLSSNLTAELSPKAMGATRFLVMYCNLLGVNYQKVEGNTAQVKAINYAHLYGVISYKPPIMHTFTADEILGILGQQTASIGA